jgi:vancomycin resistance protein YoaR
MSSELESYSSAALPAAPSRQMTARLALVLGSALILLALAVMLVAGGYQLAHRGTIFPGVSAWGTDLSEMTPAQAQAALQGKFVYPETATFTFIYQDRTWQATAAELGVRFDGMRTVQEAYSVGRRRNLIRSLREQLAAWRRGVTVSPVVVYDQSQAEDFVRSIAAQVDRPAVDATLSINGVEVTTTASQIGREVDVAATLGALAGPIASLQGGEVQLTVNETQPAIADATDAALVAQRVLSDEVLLYIEDEYARPGDRGPWVASPEALAEMLIIERVPGDDGAQRYNVRLNDAQIQGFLEPLSAELAADPVDARFIFDEGTRELELIQSSQVGRTLNVPASIQLINQSVLDGEKRIPLVFDTQPPAIADDATAAELGITELISSATTYFAGSSEARRLNIATAASRFHGLIVKPGETFSFAKYLGEVSPETGYEEALIIYAGRTIGGVGGGVCQVSTTAFQAAFYAGYPIDERWPHGYRVGYYETGEGVGMDATVFAPIVDFRFTNDTPYHLLIETYTNREAATVTWKFYSTSDRRTVSKDGPYISNIVRHKGPLYEVNPDLRPGTRKQVDYAADGADVTVYRTVYREGLVLYQDTFTSHYLPWRAVYQVPPGEVPPGAELASDQ